MKRTLVGLTLGQVTLLVAALAGYLIAIAATLRSVSTSLARIAFGVRAIERQTEPIAPALAAVNDDLEAIAAALERAGERAPGGA